MLKHPRVSKKVSYCELVEELFQSHISDDSEEDKLIKKTIVNTNYGMREKQISRNQTSKLFHTHEEAKLVQLKYRGASTSLQEYLEITNEAHASPLDNDIEKNPRASVAGPSIYQLSPALQTASATELLAQRHNFFRNTL